MTSQSGRIDRENPRRIHWEFYDDETPMVLIKFFEWQLQLLERLPGSIPDLRYRYRFYYGNRDTGALNLQLGPDEGYIALANDDRFMLLHNANSTQGPGVMMRFIVKIERCSGPPPRTLYRHPRFHTPTPDEMERDPVITTTDTRRASRIVIRRQ